MTSPPKLDARKLRADFPIFEQEIHGKPLAYLDSAATAQKPRQVLDALRTFYETSYANVHRGVYELCERATAAYEGARDKLATFVNAPSAKELIFTRNATESLNLVAYAWGLVNLGPGDVVVVTELEHHSNFVPWQYIAKQSRRRLPDDPARRPRRARSRRSRRRRQATGTFASSPRTSSRTRSARSIPLERLAAWAHEQGRDHGRGRGSGGAAPGDRRAGARLRLPRVLVAQAVRPDERRRALGTKELLDAMEPFNLGGHMIRAVRARGDDLGRGAGEVRGRHAADRRGRRASARRSTT